jgi:uncharacterized membrane protein YoaK (UPF0700 family)
MPPHAPESGEPSKATTLASAILLAATGGLLDAVVYLDHGHVFANAMTGNVIFLGIAAISPGPKPDWSQVFRYALPIVAFLVGVVIARLLSGIPQRHGALLTLVVEASALFAIGFLPPSFPQLAFVAIIALVSASQVTTFRRVGRFTYNSTFVTGNLREMIEGAYDHFRASDPATRYLGRAKFTKLALICAAFLLGAVAGALAARHFPAHAIWFADPPLLAVILLTLNGRTSR